MKNFFLITIVAFLIMAMPSKGFGQARLNCTIDKVKQDFEAPRFNLTEEAVEEGVKCVYVTTAKSLVFYYFDETDTCRLCIIRPLTQEDLNFYVRHYDSIYKASSKQSWNAYTDTGIAQVKLEFSKDPVGALFIWSMEE